jgi:hypothetical protein
MSGRQVGQLDWCSSFRATCFQTALRCGSLLMPAAERYPCRMTSEHSSILVSGSWVQYTFLQPEVGEERFHSFGSYLSWWQERWLGRSLHSCRQIDRAHLIIEPCGSLPGFGQSLMPRGTDYRRRNRNFYEAEVPSGKQPALHRRPARNATASASPPCQRNETTFSSHRWVKKHPTA